MLDIEKVAQEFGFLRERLKEIAGLIQNDSHREACFLAGCLHSICHNHSVTIGMMAPKAAVIDETKETAKDEPVD